MKKNLLKLQNISILLISVFFFACENPTDIGIDFGGTGVGTSIFTDTVSIKTSTLLADSNVTGRSSFLLTGITEDPVFGKIKSIGYFQPTLRLQADSVAPFILKTGAIADSVRLRIVNTGLVFGDTLPLGTFGIHRLQNSMSFTKNYNGEEGIPYDPNPLVKFKINSRTFKNATFDSTVAFYVTLPKSIAEELVRLSPTVGRSNSIFNSSFKGFAIVPESDVKAVYGFNTGAFASATCTFITYWHYANESSNFAYEFDLNGARHSQLQIDRSGTDLALLNQSNREIGPINGNTYIQSGSGIGTKIDLSNLKNLGRNIRISKAILEFKLDETMFSSQIPKVFNHVLGELDAQNKQIRNSANKLLYVTPIGSDLSGLTYKLVDSTNSFNVDITNFAQKITNNTKLNTAILLMPANLTTTGNAIVQNDQLRRSVIRKPKLVLYYTKF
jgi:hypothetical protein